MLSQEKLQRLANSFMDEYCNDENARFHSYDHAHKAFRDGLYNDTVSDDELAKDLFVFLASWGMCRNSFLLQKDYKFLIQLIPIFRKSDYRFLMDVNPFTIDKNKYITGVCALKKELNDKVCKQKYSNYSKKTKKTEYIEIGELSDKLIGKILLVVYGCVPAYDRFVKHALGELKISQQFNAAGLWQLLDWTNENKDKLTAVAAEINTSVKYGVPYSIMKAVDMILWEYGRELE